MHHLNQGELKRRNCHEAHLTINELCEMTVSNNSAVFSVQISTLVILLVQMLISKVRGTLIEEAIITNVGAPTGYLPVHQQICIDLNCMLCLE